MNALGRGCARGSWASTVDPIGGEIRYKALREDISTGRPRVYRRPSDNRLRVGGSPSGGGAHLRPPRAGEELIMMALEGVGDLRLDNEGEREREREREGER